MIDDPRPEETAEWEAANAKARAEGRIWPDGPTLDEVQVRILEEKR